MICILKDHHIYRNDGNAKNRRFYYVYKELNNINPGYILRVDHMPITISNP